MVGEQRIFISHVEEDAPLALTMAERLERNGYSTWYFERDSLPGISYLEETGKAIERCKAFLLIISKDSLGSHQIDLELERAFEESKTIIPIRRGVSHPEFQNRRPLWKQIIGTRTSIEVDMEHVDLTVTRIREALKQLDIANSNSLPAPPQIANLALPKFCRYCGRLFQQGETKCGKCGKPRGWIGSGQHIVKEYLGLIEYDDGCIVDPTLKLLWQRDDDEVGRDYMESLVFCKELRLGGYSNWRLPTKEELMHLARFGFEDLKKVFPNIQKKRYWALESLNKISFANNAQNNIAFTVDLDPRSSNFGVPITYFKTEKYYAKAVRSYR